MPRLPDPPTNLLTATHLLVASIGLLALLLRLWDVGARAMHLDEATVAWFGWQLLTGHGYSYDPVYHGPFQHEMLALMFLLFGSSQTTARLMAVVLGSALAILPWFLRDYLGRAATLIGCFLLAVSPSFVYFGRFERDDTYMEFFTFLLVVAVLRFMRDRRPWQLYIAAVAFALAFSTKETIYIVAFIFGSFLMLWWLGGLLRTHTTVIFRFIWSDGRIAPRTALLLGILLAFAGIMTPLTGLYLPVPAVIGFILIALVIGFAASNMFSEPVPFRSVLTRQWLNATTVAVGIIILMYSTFGTNLNGLWDHAHPLLNTGHTCQYSLAFNLNACRKDIVGGLLYWLSQHKVARGGQPWYYYLLIFGLYEQLALIFGAVAIIRTILGRQLSAATRGSRIFLTYWAILALMVYSWAGEKFPWLGIHPLLPLTLLAAVGIADTFRSDRVVVQRLALCLVLALLAIEIHNTYLLNYVNSANPVEMMVYVQSSPNTLADATRIETLSNRATNGPTLPVTIDSIDAWPFAWYLRTMPNVAYPSGAQAVKAPYVDNPIVILDQTDAQTLKLPPRLDSEYTRTLRRLDWWFPEDYKRWTWSTLSKRILDPSTWTAVWNWEVWRTPFGPRDGTWYYLYVKRGYFAPF